MKGVPQGRYMKEFREEAVKLVTEENISLPEAAPSALSLPPATLATWLKAYKAGRLGEVGRAQRPLTEIEMEAGPNEESGTCSWSTGFWSNYFGVSNFWTPGFGTSMGGV